MSEFYVPEKLKIGFQKTELQYIETLGFINYYKPNGELRFKSNFENWIDSNIPTIDCDNVPIEGFVLDREDPKNKYRSFNNTPDYIRVYDPREWEFNITTQNLMYILDYCEIQKGKLLTGKFVYAWIGDKGNNVQLLPIKSPDYKQALSNNKFWMNQKVFEEKDFVLKNIYRHKKYGRCVYIGKYTKMEYSHRDNLTNEFIYKNKGKFHYFVSLSNDDKLRHVHSVSKKSLTQFIGVESQPCSDFIYDMCEKYYEFETDYSMDKSGKFLKNREILKDLNMDTN